MRSLQKRLETPNRVVLQVENHWLWKQQHITKSEFGTIGSRQVVEHFFMEQTLMAKRHETRKFSRKFRRLLLFHLLHIAHFYRQCFCASPIYCILAKWLSNISKVVPREVKREQCPERRISGDAEKSQQCREYFLYHSSFSRVRP